MKLLKQILEWIEQRQVDKTMLFEMSNLGEKTTGLPYVIFVNVNARSLRHAARIKVCQGIRWKKGEDCNIQIQGEWRVLNRPKWMRAQDEQLIHAWVNINYDAIISYWNGELDTADFLTMLKRL